MTIRLLRTGHTRHFELLDAISLLAAGTFTGLTVALTRLLFG
jgi:hypothetical protein